MAFQEGLVKAFEVNEQRAFIIMNLRDFQVAPIKNYELFGWMKDEFPDGSLSFHGYHFDYRDDAEIPQLARLAVPMVVEEFKLRFIPKKKTDQFRYKISLRFPAPKPKVPRPVLEAG